MEYPSVIKERVCGGRMRRDVYFAVPCAFCGEARFLRKTDALRAEGKPCFRCSQQQKARKGYAATAKKHGKDFALRAVQEYRLQHPSALEREVIDLLQKMQVSYKREVLLGSVYLIDFVVADHFAIEVNGSYWHQTRSTKDLRKAQVIRAAGYSLLVLREEDQVYWGAMLVNYLYPPLMKGAA